MVRLWRVKRCFIRKSCVMYYIYSILLCLINILWSIFYNLVIYVQYLGRYVQYFAMYLSNEFIFFGRCSLIKFCDGANKLNNARFENFIIIICTHRCSYKSTSFEKEQSIAYIFIFKTFPSTHFKWSLIIIYDLYRLGV